MTEAAAIIERLGGAPALPAGGPDWLAAMRAAGQSRFAALGLPTQKAESWKYTSLRKLESLRFAPPRDAVAAIGSVPTLLGSDWDSHRLVFVDGRARPELFRLGALPDGLTLQPLATALAEQPALLQTHLGHVAGDQEQPLLALNTALMEDGFVIHVAEGLSVKHPIEIVFLRDPGKASTAAHPRCVVILEQGATATLIEHHSDEGERPYLSNLASEVSVARNARLRHVKVQEDSTAAFHFATTHVRVAEDATYDSFASRAPTPSAASQAPT
jgi:Fe-S cluster assembly protein SufD